MPVEQAEIVYHKSEVGGLAMKRISIILVAVVGVSLAAMLAGCGPGPSYDKGRQNYDAGSYDTAVAEFNKALAKDKNNEYPDTKDWIVKCYIANGKKKYEANNLYAAITDYAKGRDEGTRLQADPALISEAEQLYNDASAELAQRKTDSLALMEQGKQAFDEKRYDDAENLLKDAINKDPQNAKAKGLLTTVTQAKANIAKAQGLVTAGNAMLARENVDLKTAEAALKNFNQAKVIDPDNADADAGIAAANEKIGTIHQDAQAQFEEGVVKFNEGNFADAIAAFNECIRLDYTHKDAPIQLAEAKRMQQAANTYQANLAKAQAKMDTEITTVPAADAAIKLCDSAINCYKPADITRFPDLAAEARQLKTDATTKRQELVVAAEAHFQAGETALQASEFKTAAGEYEQCLAINPGHAQAKSQLATVNETLQEQESLQALIDEGEALLKDGKPLEAKASFQNALKLDPNNAQAADGITRADTMINAEKAEAKALYDSAMKKKALKDYDGALADLDAAIEKDPNTANYKTQRTAIINLLAGSFYKAGQEQEKLGKWVLAQKEYEKALAYDKKYQKDVDRMVNESHAEAFILVGDKAFAKKNYTTAAQNYKDALDITFRKALVREKLNLALDPLKAAAENAWDAGDYEEALKQMDAILAIDETYDDLKATVAAHRAALDKATQSYDDAVAAETEKKLVAAKALLDGIVAQLPKYEDVETRLKNIDTQLAAAKAAYDRAKRYETQAAAAAAVADELRKWDLALSQYEDVLAIAVDYADAAAIAEQLTQARAKYDEAEGLMTEKKLEEALAAYQAVDAIRKGYADIAAKMDTIQDKMAEVAYLYKAGVKCQDKQDWKGAINNYNALLAIIYQYKDVAKRLEECQSHVQP